MTEIATCTATSVERSRERRDECEPLLELGLAPSQSNNRPPAQLFIEVA